MRIISSLFKGKQLFTPKDQTIRPTLDRHRESIFNILEHASWAKDLQLKKGQWEILDLFCGTGALGIEAFSRGGKKVTFVDQDIHLCQKNVRALDLKSPMVQLIQADAISTQLDFKAYDLIFADPPYALGLVQKILTLLKTQLSAHQILVIEHEVKLEINLEGFEEMRNLKTKTSMIRFLKLAVQEKS